MLWVGVTFYAIFGGADFGAGLWTLLAGAGEKNRRPRQLVDWAIGPVWEANHVWLIFVLVVFWTAFPEAFASVFSTLFIPLSLAALGIVLRGAGFAFHKLAPRVRGQLAAEGMFAVASVLTPFFLGTVVGAVAAGRVPVGNAAGDAFTSWLNPLSLLDRGDVRGDRRLPVGGLPDQRCPPRGSGGSRALLPRARARRGGGRGACSRSRASSRCATMRASSTTGSRATACRW